MLTCLFWIIVILVIIVLIALGFVLGGGLLWLFGDILFLVLSIVLVSKLFKRRRK